MNTRLPKIDSATGRGLRTGAFATLSALIVFVTGFIGVINNVPGCSKAVIDFLQANALQLSLLVGVPAGAFSFAVNFFRKNVKNY